nr:metal ABC transporter substrate-binding protein [Nocardia lijiangensis]
MDDRAIRRHPRRTAQARHEPSRLRLSRTTLRLPGDRRGDPRRHHARLPSPADLAGLAEAVRAAGVGAIFADSAQPDRLARVLAEQAGVHVRVVPLHSESLTGPGGGAETYLAMMRANTEAIARGLAP